MMKQLLLTISQTIDRINEAVGRAVSWLTFALVILICVDVALRYLFDFTQIWIIELEIYFFAFIFILGAGYSFLHDKHVRVDVFYTHFSERRKAWVNLVGGLIFLVPWCFIMLQVAWRYAKVSFSYGESSPQAGGLPALYILKFSIVVGFVLLMGAAISSILKSLLVLLEKPNSQPVK